MFRTKWFQNYLTLLRQEAAQCLMLSPEKEPRASTELSVRNFNALPRPQLTILMVKFEKRMWDWVEQTLRKPAQTSSKTPLKELLWNKRGCPRNCWKKRWAGMWWDEHKTDLTLSLPWRDTWNYHDGVLSMLMMCPLINHVSLNAEFALLEMSLLWQFDISWHKNVFVMTTCQ